MGSTLVNVDPAESADFHTGAGLAASTGRWPGCGRSPGSLLAVSQFPSILRISR